jgi:VanZ family protein
VNRWVIGFSVVLLYWIVGFYPFHWAPPSRFRAVAHGREIQYITTQVVENAGARSSAEGLQFVAPAIALLPSRLTWLPDAIEASSLAVELRVRPYFSRQYGPARILTISQDIWERNLTIGQQGTDLIIRVRTPETDLNGVPPYQLNGVFAATDTRHISLRIARGSMSVRIDGEEALAAVLPPEAFSRWSPDYRLAFGNELTFDRPWLGDIYQATVGLGRGTVDHALPGALDIPNPFVIEHVKRFSLVPFSIQRVSNLKAYVDWAVNFIGFLALGLLIIYVRGRSSSLFVAALLCAALSLSIEVGQLFLGGRIPSTEDLILNITGGSFGAWVVKRSSKKSIVG